MTPEAGRANLTSLKGAPPRSPKNFSMASEIFGEAGVENALDGFAALRPADFGVTYAFDEEEHGLGAVSPSPFEVAFDISSATIGREPDPKGVRFAGYSSREV
jgi:hypothetical protein